MSRRGTEVRRRNHQIGVRLTAEEWREVQIVADALDISPGEVFRRAYAAAHDLDALLEAVEAATSLGEGWVGFDDSHHYGDALLQALAPVLTRVIPPVTSPRSEPVEE